MGFQVIEAPRRGVSSAPCLISIATKGGQRLRLSFSDTLAKQLGWSEGKLLEVASGTGDDAGWIRLRPAQKGSILRRANKKSARISLMATLPIGWPAQAAPAEPERMLPTQSVGGGELKVKVPFAIGALALAASK